MLTSRYGVYRKGVFSLRRIYRSRADRGFGKDEEKGSKAIQSVSPSCRVGAAYSYVSFFFRHPSCAGQVIYPIMFFFVYRVVGEYFCGAGKIRVRKVGVSLIVLSFTYDAMDAGYRYAEGCVSAIVVYIFAGRVRTSEEGMGADSFKVAGGFYGRVGRFFLRRRLPPLGMVRSVEFVCVCCVIGR